MAQLLASKLATILNILAIAGMCSATEEVAMIVEVCVSSPLLATNI